MSLKRKVEIALNMAVHSHLLSASLQCLPWLTYLLYLPNSLTRKQIHEGKNILTLYLQKTFITEPLLNCDLDNC